MTTPGLRRAHRKIFWYGMLFNVLWMVPVGTIAACKKKEATGVEATAAVKAAQDTMTIIRKGELCFAVITVPDVGVGMANIPCPASEWSGTPPATTP